MTDAPVSPFSYSPFSKDVLRNPIPYYRELRKNHPVYYVEEYDMFVFTRYREIIEALSVTGENTFMGSESTLPLPSTISHRNDGAPPVPPVKPMGPGPTLPSPQYEEMRLAHIAPLRPRKVKEIQDLVREMVLERLRVLLPKGKFDIMNDFGGMVSAAVTCHLYGIPLSRAKEVMDAVNAVSGYNENLEGISTPAMFEQLQKFIVPAIESRRAAGADGSVPLVDGLINHRVEEDGRSLTDEEISNQLVCVFVANTETPPKPAGQGLLELARHPDQLAEVRADLDTNVPIAVEEMLRICTSNQWVMRTAHKDVTIAGQHIRPGQRILASVFSAARDEQVFDNAEEFIWNREIPARTLTFGLGQHHCVGNHIARLQINTMVKEFLNHVDAYEFAMDEAVHSSSYFHWSYTYLPVVIKQSRL